MPDFSVCLYWFVPVVLGFALLLGLGYLAWLAYTTLASRAPVTCTQGDPVDLYKERCIKESKCNLDEWMTFLGQSHPSIVTKVEIRDCREFEHIPETSHDGKCCTIFVSDPSGFLFKCFETHRLDQVPDAEQEALEVQYGHQCNFEQPSHDQTNLCAWHGRIVNSIRGTCRMPEGWHRPSEFDVWHLKDVRPIVFEALVKTEEAVEIQQGDIFLFSSFSEQVLYEAWNRFNRYSEAYDRSDCCIKHEFVRETFDRLIDTKSAAKQCWQWSLQLYTMNLFTFFGISTSLECLSLLADQVLDILNAVLNYFLNAGYPVLGSLSLSLFIAPATLHWILDFSFRGSGWSDLLLAISGLSIPVNYYKSMMCGAKLPGFFWGAIFEGIIEAPAQALLNFYTVEIGLARVTFVGISSLLFSIFMVARNLNKLDQYGSRTPWTFPAQVRNFTERLLEVSFRIASLAIFLAVMRPDVPLRESCPEVLIVLFLVQLLLCAVVICPATEHHLRTLRVLWVTMSMLARPPYFLLELRQLYPRVIALRFVEAAAMAWFAKRYGHRSPSSFEVAVLSVTSVGCASCVVIRQLQVLFVQYCGQPTGDEVGKETLSGQCALEEARGMLIPAMEDDNVMLVELMLSSGADTTMKLQLSKHGDVLIGETDVSSLIWAVEHGRLNIVRCLLRHSADPNLTAERSYDEQGVDDCGNNWVEQHDKEDISALSCAVERRSIEMVETLIEGRADIDMVLRRTDEYHFETDRVCTYEDQSALSIAARKNHQDICAVLIEKGASLSLRLQKHTKSKERNNYADGPDGGEDVVTEEHVSRTALELIRNREVEPILQAALDSQKERQESVGLTSILLAQDA